MFRIKYYILVWAIANSSVLVSYAAFLGISKHPFRPTRPGKFCPASETTAKIYRLFDDEKKNCLVFVYEKLVSNDIDAAREVCRNLSAELFTLQSKRELHLMQDYLKRYTYGDQAASDAHIIFQTFYLTIDWLTGLRKAHVGATHPDAFYSMDGSPVHSYLALYMWSNKTADDSDGRCIKISPVTRIMLTAPKSNSETPFADVPCNKVGNHSYFSLCQKNIPPVCGKPPDVIHAFVSCSDAYVFENERCLYECYGNWKGYVKVTCGSGIWHYKKNKCKAACRGIGKLPYVQSTCESTASGDMAAVNDTCDIQCVNETVMIGNPTLRCQDNGAGWTSIPRCVKTCDALRIGRGLSECSEQKFPAGSRCNVQCKRGLDQLGSSTATCTKEGVWVTSLQCRVACPPGFEGEWTDERWKCRPCHFAHYKPTAGNKACLPCPKSGKTTSDQAAVTAGECTFNIGRVEKLEMHADDRSAVATETNLMGTIAAVVASIGILFLLVGLAFIIVESKFGNKLFPADSFLGKSLRRLPHLRDHGYGNHPLYMQHNKQTPPDQTLCLYD